MEISFFGSSNKLSFVGATDTGLVRSANQDNHYVDPQGRFFILADGMGGHKGGEKASLIAVTIIKDYLDAYWDSPLESYDLLEKSIYQANEGILEDQVIHPERGEMGTTIVVVIFRNDQTWRAHVGDSRLYRLRNSKLEQISQDHTWISQAIRAGEITLEEAKTHPWRHVLSQCLGRKDLYDGIDIFTMDVEPGDRFVLCSDGLTEEVEFDLICKSLGEPETVEKAAQTLIQEAKNGGGSDNITVVVIESLAKEALNDQELADEPLTNGVLANKALTDKALTDEPLTDEVLIDKVLPKKARRIK